LEQAEIERLVGGPRRLAFDDIINHGQASLAWRWPGRDPAAVWTNHDRGISVDMCLHDMIYLATERATALVRAGGTEVSA